MVEGIQKQRNAAMYRWINETSNLSNPVTLSTQSCKNNIQNYKQPQSPNGVQGGGWAETPKGFHCYCNKT